MRPLRRARRAHTASAWRHALAGSLAFLFVTAGCLDTSGSTKKDAASPTGAFDDQPDLDAGSIAGLVADTEFVPVEGAEVKVSARDEPGLAPLNAQTNAVGRFHVGGLTAGEYFIHVSKLGFRDVSGLSVPVTPGLQSNVTVVMEPLTRFKPHHVTTTYRAYFEHHFCLLLLGVPTSACYTYDGHMFTNEPRGPRHLRVEEAESGLLETLIIESRWTPTIGVCPGAIRTDTYSPDQGDVGPKPYSNSTLRDPKNPYHWDNLPRVASPTHLLIPREGAEPVAMHSPQRTSLNHGRLITTSGLWTIAPFVHPQGRLGTPVDFDCAVQLSVEVAMTQFLIQPAPSTDWSYFASG